MCGRFAQQRPASELAELFAAAPLGEDAQPRFNVAPTSSALVVVERDDRRAIMSYRWGLIPHWAESPKIAARTFNARSETLAASPMFRDSFRRRRCLVPVDAFYEWQRHERAHQPYVVRRRDGAPLALAGLWSGWRDPETDEVHRTFTIVTTAANELIAPLHDRMPAILTPDEWARWLEPTAIDPAELLGLLVPADPDPLEVYAVGRAVNDVRNDGPDLLRPVPA